MHTLILTDEVQRTKHQKNQRTIEKFDDLDWEDNDCFIIHSGLIGISLIMDVIGIVLLCNMTIVAPCILLALGLPFPIFYLNGCIRYLVAKRSETKLRNGGYFFRIEDRNMSTWRKQCKDLGIDPKDPRANIDQFPDAVEDVVELQALYENPQVDDDQKDKVLKDIQDQIEYVMREALRELADVVKEERKGAEEVARMVRAAEQQDKERQQLTAQAAKEAQDQADQRVYASRLQKALQRN